MGGSSHCPTQWCWCCSLCSRRKYRSASWTTVFERVWVECLSLGSLVGVAISGLFAFFNSLFRSTIESLLLFLASLLPPAVNGGLLFAYAFLGLVFPRAVAVQSSVFKANSNDSSSALHCAPYLRNDYLPMYTCTLANEAAILGCCSLLLTIVNILCIVVMALFILRIKEVAPLNHSNKEISDFFHHDVKVARDYNKTIHESDLNPTATLSRNQLAQSIVNQWKTFKATRTQNVQQTSENKVVDPSVTFDMEMRRRLFRLKTFAKEYDLDVFNKDDYDLISPESREKVRLLVNDLIDMCHETPAVFIDLYRLQPLDTQTSADGEHAAFYREILELLPSKWYQLFMAERQRRHLTAEPLALNRSNSMRSYPLEAYGNLQSSTRRTDQNPSIHFQRQSSVPESASVRQVAEEPIKGTRFRLVKQWSRTIEIEIFSRFSLCSVNIRLLEFSTKITNHGLPCACHLISSSFPSEAMKKPRVTIYSWSAFQESSTRTNRRQREITRTVIFL